MDTLLSRIPQKEGITPAKHFRRTVDMGRADPGDKAFGADIGMPRATSSWQPTEMQRKGWGVDLEISKGPGVRVRSSAAGTRGQRS